MTKKLFLEQPRRGKTREAQLTPHKRSAVWGQTDKAEPQCGGRAPRNRTLTVNDGEIPALEPMISATDDLRDGFSSVGGTNMQEEGYYWSSTEEGSSAWDYYFYYGGWETDSKHSALQVRACLAF